MSPPVFKVVERFDETHKWYTTIITLGFYGECWPCCGVEFKAIGRARTHRRSFASALRQVADQMDCFDKPEAA